MTSNNLVLLDDDAELVELCRGGEARGFRTHAGEPAPPPERELGHRELRGEIDRALGLLSEEQRALVLLKGVEDLSYEEIGAVVGQSENQIRGKLYRARKVFRDVLGEP